MCLFNHLHREQDIMKSKKSKYYSWPEFKVYFSFRLVPLEKNK